MDFAPYAGAIEVLGNTVSTVIKKIFPDKMAETDAAKMQQEITMALLSAEMAPVLAQLDINRQEAAHDSIFVAGWRPFVGWVCGAALAYHFIFLPLMTFVIACWKWQVPPLPVFDMGSLMTILLGMLGLSLSRSYEKIKGETTTATKVGA